MRDLLSEALALQPYTSALRRDLHRFPELGFKEFRTAGIISRELQQFGFEVRSGIAETGVVALMEGAYPGKVVLLRFDMDALPIQEETGADYASQSAGVMHACGHDGHVAVGLSVARLLSQHRAEIHGTIKLVFQPAEEGLGGAERMLAAGVLDHPTVDSCLALHLWNEKPLGWLGIPPGPLMAGADIFSIRIEGKGGHGALPHQSVDPVVAAAQVIIALQTIVSRNVSPLDNAVVTVTRLRAGEAYNVIPQTAELAGTIRAFDEDVRGRVIERMESIVQGVTKGMGCSAEVKVTRLTPAVINHPGLAQCVKDAAHVLLPDDLIDEQYRSMVSEDMAYMMRRVPGCYFMVGSANPARGLDFGHHHPRFDFDEDVLPKAVTLMAGSAMALLT